MKCSGKVALVFATALWGMSGQTAEAQVSGFYGGGYGLRTGLYGMMITEPPPYYAIFPPVYYSFPVARTYGYSPFAYPPGTLTPEPERVAPQEMLNPYVPRKPAKKPAARTTLAPREIVNPFVERRRPAATLRASAQAPLGRESFQPR